jgi:uncharacterized protein DUF488
VSLITPSYRRRYRHQLHKLTLKLLAELQDLRGGYDQPMVLLCHCDLTRPDGWCHRTILDEWISQKTGDDVPER